MVLKKRGASHFLPHSAKGHVEWCTRLNYGLVSFVHLSYCCAHCSFSPSLTTTPVCVFVVCIFLLFILHTHTHSVTCAKKKVRKRKGEGGRKVDGVDQCRSHKSYEREKKKAKLKTLWWPNEECSDVCVCVNPKRERERRHFTYSVL